MLTKMNKNSSKWKLINNNSNQLISVILFVNILLLGKEIRNFYLSIFSRNVTAQQIQFKPITNFVFNFYKTIFFFNKVRFYLTCLVWGEPMIKLLCHSLYRKIDQSKIVSKQIIFIFFSYNVCIFIVLNLFDSFQARPLSMLESIQFFNHSMLIELFTFYITFISQIYFDNLTQWLKKSK